MTGRSAVGRGNVVVGFDGPDQAGLLTIAADEAERRGTELAVVTVLHPRLDPELTVLGQRREQQRAQATALQNLHAAAASLRGSHPRLSVTTYCLGDGEVGPNREPLLWAELLVIGSSGCLEAQGRPGGSGGRTLLLGSRCPVLAVPENVPSPTIAGQGEPPLILVGVSAHPSDAAVVHTAYALARSRAGDVLLLHAVSGQQDDAEQARNREVLAGFAAQAPGGVRVSVVLTEDEPAGALVRLTPRASLLVIGGRAGSLSGLVSDSVSQAVLSGACCPVLAIPRNVSSGLLAVVSELAVAETGH
jgi:nucleotide-binding universal stress UspA family protein